MSSRQGRIAHNQAMTRQINEQIQQGRRPVEGYIWILCECRDLDCDLLVAITIPEYEALRADATRFAVVPTHVIPEVDRVVEQTDRYMVVAKREEAPRS